MKKKTEKEYASLCYRCEHRARHCEDSNYQPRWECGDIKRAVCSCYMFKPVMPLVLRPSEGDKRPFLGPWMISARTNASKPEEESITLKVDKVKNGVLLYWNPTDKKEK